MEFRSWDLWRWPSATARSRCVGASLARCWRSCCSSRLQPGDRLILLTDGILERHTQDGSRFGVEGLQSALERVENATAAATAMAIQSAVTDCWSEPLEDDATVVVLAVA